MKTHILLARVLACAALVLVTPGYSSEKIPVTGSGFVAKDDSLRTFFRCHGATAKGACHC